MLDFPAAHSMDTTWFAVDADGCIGVFESGENGAVPDRSFNVENLAFDRSEFLRTITQDKRDKIYSLWTRDLSIVKKMNSEFLKETVELYKHIYGNDERDSRSIEVRNLLLLMSSRSEISILKSTDNLVINFPVLHPRIAYVDRCALDRIERGTIDGSIVSGKTFYLENNLFLLGCYEFSCPSYGVLPYEREQPIENSISLETIATQSNLELQLPQFSQLRFSENRLVQPIEHLPCHTWKNEEDWIDVRGNERDRFPQYPPAEI